MSDPVSARLKRLFESAVEPPAQTGGPAVWSPLADVVETDEGFRVFLDLPGIDPDRVTVRIDGRRVAITGQRNYPSRAPETVARLECHYGDFARLIELPASVSAAFERRYEAGVLVLELMHG